MSKLEQLVPPLELCKLIPKGEFEDCALVWMDSAFGIKVFINSNIVADHLAEKYPAPTLQEIMEDLGQFTASCFDKGYRIEIATDWDAVSDYNAVVAALKLWLKLKGIEYEKE